MASPCFIAFNAATGALTGPPTAVATAATSGTVKTMLQIVPATTQKIRVIEWGYTLDAAPASNVRIELVETGAVAATVTAHVAAGIISYNDASGGTSAVQLSTSTTGYTASAEGSITVNRPLDYHYENGLYYVKQFPLGREPEVGVGKVLRVRATPTSAASVNITCWVAWEE